MKISDLNKQELLILMQENGEIHRPTSGSKCWQHAFKLAKKNGLEDVDMECDKCYKRVREWLER